MAFTGASLCPSGISSVFGREMRPSAEGSSKFKSNSKVLISTRRLALSAEQPPATLATEWRDGDLEKERREEKFEEEGNRNTRIDVEEKEKGMRKNGSEQRVLEVEEERMSLKDYFDQAKDLIKSSADGGPPRWFSLE